MKKFKRIGLYGVSSTGKTTIAKHIENSFNHFKYIDGSEIIDKVCPGGLSMFKKLNTENKYKYRQDAISYLKEYQIKINKNLIIAGHFSFLNNDGNIEKAWTQSDDQFYTDIIYIRDEPQNIYNRCISRNKICLSIGHIKEWIKYEEKYLNTLVNQSTFQIKSNNLKDKFTLIQELINKIILQTDVITILEKNEKKLTILLDADGTLIPYDSAQVMSKHLNQVSTSEIKKIFQKYDKYYYESFYEVAKYYSKYNSYLDFIKASNKSAMEIEIREDFVDLINQIDANFIIVTAGFSILWENLIKKHKLTNINLIAGNTIYDDYIVGQNEKGYIVDILKKHRKTVVCFGDALVDKNMFIKSDLGYLIINEREKSITPILKNNKKYKYISYKNIELKGILKTNFIDIKIKLRTLYNG